MKGYYSHAGYVGALSIVLLSFSLLLLKRYGVIPHIQNLHIFLMIGITFLMMVGAEFFLQKRYLRKRGISYRFEELSGDTFYLLRSTCVRYIALLIPLLFFYAIIQNHYYFTHTHAFDPTRELFDYLLYIYILFAFPYIFLTLKYKGAHRYEIGDYAILSIVALKSFFQHMMAKLLHKTPPKYSLYKNRRVKKVLLLYLVNFFFLTLMARFIVQEFHGFEQELQKIFSVNFSHLHWYNQYKTFFLLLFHILFTIDVGIAIIGYSFASRWLFNRTRSVDRTLSGWMVALICYPPFNAITTQFFGYTGLPTHNLFSDERILAVILTIVIVLYFIYVWATVALGFKFSNLTNRGIVDRGPYAIIRHPAYVAKNSAWWMDNTFVLTNIWATLALAVWNIIYILRGLTEERHLAQDMEYRKYQQKVKYKFIPKVI